MSLSPVPYEFFRDYVIRGDMRFYFDSRTIPADYEPDPLLHRAYSYDPSQDPVETERSPSEKQKRHFERSKALGRNSNGVPTRKGKGKGRMS